MKVIGIILIVLGAINVIVGFSWLSTPIADRAGGKIGFSLGVLVLGVYLVNRAIQKANEEKEKKDWEDGKN